MTVRPSEVQSIRVLPLFQQMSEQGFADMMAQSMLQRFPARADLIKEGDLPDFLYIVVEGAVDLYAARDGEETTIDIVYPSSSFILAAVMRDEPYLKSARTLMSSQILMIPSQTVRNAFNADPAFARGIVDELAARYRAVTRVLKNDRMRSSTERLANWILGMAKRSGSHEFALPLEKRKLASFLGMTPESYSRSIAALEKHGVRSIGSMITITDPASLTEFAKPTAIETD